MIRVAAAVLMLLVCGGALVAQEPALIKASEHEPIRAVQPSREARGQDFGAADVQAV